MRRRAVLGTTMMLATTLAGGVSSEPRAQSALRPLQDIHEELLGKFTPIEQRAEDERLINHFGDVPFTGDCDDYYMAAYNQLQVWGYIPHAKFVRTKKEGKRHLLACTEGPSGATRCLDPNHHKVRTLSDLRRVYRILETRRLL